MRGLLIALILLLMLALQQVHAHFPSDLASRSALVLGFLLLAGFLLGELTARISVPRITGYLLAGVACGPYALGMVDAEVVEHLRLVDKLALALIAFTAGAELRYASLRARIKAILSVTLVQTIVVFSITAGALYLLRTHLSLFDGVSGGMALAVALVLGLIATAKSPATTVAVIVETRAKGPVTDAVLGITVIKDIVVLVGFSLLMGLVVPALSQQPHAVPTPGMPTPAGVMLEVLLSLPVGAVLGLLMIGYFRYVNRQNLLFVVAAAFLLISVCEAFHLDPLLVAVVAGFVLSNFSSQGEVFLNGLKGAAGPVFLIFFSLAGAGLNLGLLSSLWPMVLIYLLLRTGSMWLGTWLGAVVAGEGEGLRRFAWTGFLGQAGVSLGLALLVRAQFPNVGAAVADLVVGAIVVNQIVGPVAFRWALVRLGEANLTQESSEAKRRET